MPLAPPVIKIVLLVSFIIKYLLSYVTIYTASVPASTWTDRFVGRSIGSMRSLSPARPRREHLQQRTCGQALYQACPPPSSAQEKRARGRSRCGSAGLERFWSDF